MNQLSKLISRGDPDSRGLELWSTPDGQFWAPTNESSLPLELSEQELGIYETDSIGARKGDVVLDCGAHLGLYTKKALTLGAKLVIAIEPSPASVECLRRNLRTEIQAGKVIVFSKGVWDREDVLTLGKSPKFSAGDSLVMQENRIEEGTRVALTTIDNIVSELKLEKVDFIKMDIEGAEQKALAGAIRVLSKHRPRLAISVYHRIEDIQKVPVIVRKAWAGYQMTCGICGSESGRFQPEFLFFH
jgi:FkbM family methyltransferase